MENKLVKTPLSVTIKQECWKTDTYPAINLGVPHRVWSDEHVGQPTQFIIDKRGGQHVYLSSEWNDPVIDHSIVFALKVRNLRTLQKEFFLTRDGKTLAAAKQQELEVDGMVESYLTNGAKQLDLFNQNSDQI